MSHGPRCGGGHCALTKCCPRASGQRAGGTDSGVHINNNKQMGQKLGTLMNLEHSTEQQPNSGPVGLAGGRVQPVAG